jgi:hypothetical protein
MMNKLAYLIEPAQEIDAVDSLAICGLERARSRPIGPFCACFCGHRS